MFEVYWRITSAKGYYELRSKWILRKDGIKQINFSILFQWKDFFEENESCFMVTYMPKVCTLLVNHLQNIYIYIYLYMCRGEEDIIE